MEALPFTLAVTAIATFVAEQLTDEELALAAVVLTQAADTMATALVLREKESKETSADLEFSRETDLTSG